MKLIVLYKEPEDTEAFDRWYMEEHVRLVNKVPGVIANNVTRFTRTLAGDGFYLMAEICFADKDTMKESMRSSEMAEVGKNANAHAEGLMTMMFGEEIN